MTRALAMISGGLDSILAAKLIKDQGIEVIGICFRSYFFNEENAKKMTKQIDIPLEVIDFSKEHFEMVKDPKNGWGKNMNPCIDCHAMMMRYSGELLKKFNADFIITGEVLNQRPMSQNRQALNKVRKESGFEDKILRPLCAQNLDETEMEKSGLVDREKLLKISGRSRKIQMELAEKWGIKDYPSPAGGCKLTEPNYSIRLKETLQRNGDATSDEIELLRFGRHFVSDSGCKIIATRTKDEADKIKQFLSKEDLVFYPVSYNGAMIIINGKHNEKDKELAAKIAGRYCKGKDLDEIEVSYGKFGCKFEGTLKVKPATEEEIDRYIIQGK
ncbi:tRNA U34 2-thiouridine synthase MnmA/TrmU [Clostridium moniliforme]|uniref:tRNA U34 2-thiouridine synthase MnmA/TrmU n=1 Tax=Clostridium moniliforme TaxID=39489 RepID=A0ABS4F326_9CLOT|nr:tRNA 4-thiouridine(8) synthase ThiI [Clostridium moniliforme]MBP1890653.1 tRNA U34 2-thiouridine synthase MnmA/TrmU [Clostridium moniliforme]